MRRENHVFRGFRKQIIALLAVLCLMLTLLQPAVEARAGSGVTATVSDVTVDGYVGEYIDRKTITIILNGGKLVDDIIDEQFKIQDSAGSSNHGLHIQSKKKSSTEIELILYGIAKGLASGPMTIKISGLIGAGGDLTVTEPNAKFNITEAPDSCVGNIRFNSDNDFSGEGWNWNSTLRILTLSGVNITGDNPVITTKFLTRTDGIDHSDAYKRGIYIGGADPVKVVLEGANKIAIPDQSLKNKLLAIKKYQHLLFDTLFLGAFENFYISGLASKGKMTIEGSGKLDIELSDSKSDSGERLFIYPISVDSGSLTINSGIITCSGKDSVLVNGHVTINGGYLDVKTISGAAIQCLGPDSGPSNSYTQNGGYVKAASESNYGIHTNKLLLSGGYLEASGGNAGIVYTSEFVNDGGVIKVTGGNWGIFFSKRDVGSVELNGGVTIASSTNAVNNAINVKVHSDNNEMKLYDNTNSPVFPVEIVNTTDPVSRSAIVAAKAVTVPAAVGGVITLDSVYIKAAGSAIDPEYNVKVTGGTYLESTDSYLYSSTLKCSGLELGSTDKTSTLSTLVCESENGYGFDLRKLDNYGMLYVSSKNGCQILEGDAFTNNGEAIFVSSGDNSISIDASYISSFGQLYAINTGSGDEAYAIRTGALQALKGIITAVTSGSGEALNNDEGDNSAQLSSPNREGTITGTTSVSLININAGSGQAYCGSIFYNAVVKASREPYGTVTGSAIIYDKSAHTYKQESAPTKVLLLTTGRYALASESNSTNAWVGFVIGNDSTFTVIEREIGKFLTGLSESDRITLSIMAPAPEYEFTTAPVVASSTAAIGTVARMPDGNYTVEISGFTVDNTIIAVTAIAHYFNEWAYDETNHWRKCSDVGCTEQKEVAPHSYSDDWVVETPATCTAPGIKYKECVCGKKISETIIPPLGHNFEAAWTVDDTSHWHKCTNAGCQEKDSFAAHDYGAWVIEAPATYSAPGSKYKECSICHKKVSESIPQLIYSPPTNNSVVTPAPENKPAEKTTGKVVIDVVTEEEIGGAKFVSSEKKLRESVLTAEDKERIAKGEDASVYLEVKDISKSIKKEEREKIEQKVKALLEKERAEGKDTKKEADEEAEEEIKLLFLDISLFKKIGNSDPSKVSNPSDKIEISINIPEEMIPADKAVKRTYKIIRYHNEKAEILEGEYDAKTGTFTFETDRFSTYILTYDDIVMKVQFVKKYVTMKVGDKKYFSFVSEGYDVSRIIWKTAKKSIVTVKGNKGKTKARVKAKSVGTDTIYLRYDGGRILQLKIKVTEK